MGLNLKNLDDITRKLMLEEIEHDKRNNALYISQRLNAKGKTEYSKLLENASANSDDTKLAYDLLNCMAEKEPRRKKDGTVSFASVPFNANEILAEGEFNRFYIRALCLQVINEKKGRLRVYRAKRVSDPRPESEAKIGQFIDPNALLADLRTHPGIDTALGLPAGPNSGLSIEIVM